jgi:hypothetical protein
MCSITYNESARCFTKNDHKVTSPEHLSGDHHNNNYRPPPYSPIGRKTVKPEDAIRAHRKHSAISAPRREEIDLLTPITNVPIAWYEKQINELITQKEKEIMSV